MEAVQLPQVKVTLSEEGCLHLCFLTVWDEVIVMGENPQMAMETSDFT